MMFQTIDYIILAVIGLSIITGLFRGFLKELIALCVWVVALWMAFSYTYVLSDILKPLITEETIRNGASFIIILVVILILGAIFNAILGFILNRSGLSGTDRVLGMIFGFVRGVFIVSLVIVVMNMTSLSKKEDFAHHSVLYNEFNPMVNWLTSLMPDFVKQAKVFDNQIDKVDTAVPKK